LTHILTRSLREEGPRFFFKGWTPAFIRLGPNTVLMFVFYEVRCRLSREELFFFKMMISLCSVFVAIEAGLESGVLGFVYERFSVRLRYTRTLGLGVESDDYDNRGIYPYKLAR